VALRAALMDEHPEVRSAASWALEELTKKRPAN